MREFLRPDGKWGEGSTKGAGERLIFVTAYDLVSGRSPPQEPTGDEGLIEAATRRPAKGRSYEERGVSRGRGAA